MKVARILTTSALIFLLFPIQVFGRKNMTLIGMTGRSPTYWHIYVALQKNYFSQEGIKAKLVEFRDPSQAVKALIDGALPILGDIETEIILNESYKRDQVVALAGFLPTNLFYLMGGPNQKSVKDLRGRFIGVPRLRSGRTILIKELLSKYNLNYPKDYRLIETGSESGQLVAMLYGKISGGFLDIGISEIGKREGLNFIDDIVDIAPNYQHTVTAANKKWAEENRRLPVGVLRAIIKAIEWINEKQNREEAIYILQDKIKIDSNSANKLYDQFFQEKTNIYKNGFLQPISIKAVEENMKKAGILPPGIYDLTKIIDNSYLQDAIR